MYHRLNDFCSWFVGVALLLTSCGNDYTIALAAPNQPSSAPAFLITERSAAAGTGLPYSYIAVRDVATSEIVWEAQRVDHFRTAPTHITYGKSPDTFEQRTLAPLQPNKTYAVLVGGPGEMTGRLEFRVDESGAVRD